MIDAFNNHSFDEQAVLHRRLLFWGIAPLLTAFQHALSLADMTIAARGVYFIYLWGVSATFWMVNHIMTSLVARFFAPKKSQNQRSSYALGAAVLVAGCLLGSVIFMATQPFRAELYCHLATLTGDSCYYPKKFSFNLASLGHFTRLALMDLQFWLIFNYLVAFMFKVDRYGFTLLKRSSFSFEEGAPSGNERDASSPLLSRLPFELGTTILALEGKQHYVQVHTDKGSDLILYRLSDAMREMGGKGLQIHRSYWVAYDAITCVQKQSSTYKVVLTDTLSFPISRAFQHTLKTGRLSELLARNSKR